MRICIPLAGRFTLLLLPALLSFSVTGAQNGYDQTTLSGYYRQQDYEKAITFLKAAQTENEGNLFFTVDMGYALFMNEQYNEAKLYFQKILAQQPGNFEATLYLAQLWNILNNPDSSLFYYNSLTQNYPGNYRFWQRAGSLSYQLGKFDSSLYYFQKAYTLNNRSGRIAVSLANLFAHNKNIEAADSLVSGFLLRDSSDEEVIAKKIEISFKKSLYDTVIRWGEKLWRDSSKLAGPFVSLAYSYLNRQLYDPCLKLCNWMENENKANESVFYCEALAYARTGLYEESNLKLDTCIKMTIQDNAHIYLAAKADNFENMKNFPKAAQYYDTAWYIFHKPFDLYFAGRLYDKYLKNPAKTIYYYRLFQKNKPAPRSSGESRVVEYVENYLEEKQKLRTN